MLCKDGYACAWVHVCMSLSSGHRVGCNRLHHLEGALAACGARIHNAQTPRDPSLREEDGGGRVGRWWHGWMSGKMDGWMDGWMDVIGKDIGCRLR